MLIPVIFPLFLNSIPNDKILDWFKFKAFAEDKIKVLKMIMFVFDKVENIMGKGETLLLPTFFPFFSIVFKRLFTRGR